MNIKTISLHAVFLALALTASAGAYAHDGHHGGWHGGPHVGIWFGAPFYSPWYYYPPDYYYYPPNVVAVPQEPSVYVERSTESGDAAAASAPPAMWYFCPDSKTYYPYVKTCASKWQAVNPQPPSQ